MCYFCVISFKNRLSLYQNISIELFFNLLPIVAGLFYIIRLLFLPKSVLIGKNYIILLLFFVLSIEVFSILVDNIKNTFVYFSMAYLLGVSLSLAPTIKLAVSSYLGKKEVNVFRYYLPVIVFVLVDLVLISLLQILPKSNVLKPVVYYALWVVNFGGLTFFFVSQNFYLLYRLFNQINLYEDKIGSYYSFEEGVSLKWLKSLIYGYLAFVVGIILTSITSFGGWLEYSFDIVVSAFILYLGSKVVQYHHIACTVAEIGNLENYKETSPENLIEKEVESEVASTLKTDEIQILLEEVMEKRKPYLNPKLSIYDLAKMISTNYKYLSRHINQEYEMNFVNYINSYRIKEAKEKLLDSSTKNYKIEAIAELSGFHSKSAFNTAFKKNIGNTPSEYRNLKQL